VAVTFHDYYATLGVPRTATADDIKRAYRKLARQHHPDLQPAERRAEAAERFKEINEAHEVLSNSEKRATYDALGSNWKGGSDFTPPGSDRRSTASTEWQGPDDFSEFFASMFGGRRARGPHDEGNGDVRFSMPGGDLEAELPVTLDEMLRGGRRGLTVNDQRIEVDIPLGVRNGTTLRIAGRGRPGVGGGPPGDLFLRVRLSPHSRYRVVGDDVEVDLPLEPWQAVLGDIVNVDTPDGPVTLKIPSGTQSGRKLRLRDRGLPRPKHAGRGDFYAVSRIVVPTTPTADQRAAYEALKRSAPATTGQPT
jgi:curved DNA-binding protein